MIVRKSHHQRNSFTSAARWSDLERVTAMAFGQRRKMVRSSLKVLAPRFEELGIEPTRRAEELSIEHYCALARALAEIKPG